MVSTIPDVIKLFGGPEGFAEAVGMTLNNAKQVNRRKRLNARWFGPTVRAAEERQLPISLETLAEIAERAA